MEDQPRIQIDRNDDGSAVFIASIPAFEISGPHLVDVLADAKVEFGRKLDVLWVYARLIAKGEVL